MITDKNTIRTQNNKVATKIRTVESSQAERDKIAMDVQAFIDAGGYVQEVDSYQDASPKVQTRGVEMGLFV